MLEFMLHEWIKISLGGLTLAFGFLYKCLIRLRSQYEANTAGTKDMLASSLAKSHHDYMSRRYCSILEKQIFLNSYRSYKALGGNGLFDKIVNDVINLPEYDWHEGRKIE